MDQSVHSYGRSTLDISFQRMREASRQSPPPSLETRLDRLKRLRALITENEQRFAEAISADFSHRCAIETMIAETLSLLGEIKHTSKHLKNWMAPKTVPTQPQFWPAKNRLIPQPLGVVGIIAPWNYPLQLTIAPAIGALAAGNRVMIKPSELSPAFSALLQETVAAKFDATELTVTGIDDGIAEAFAALPFDSRRRHILECDAAFGGQLAPFSRSRRRRSLAARHPCPRESTFACRRTARRAAPSY